MTVATKPGLAARTPPLLVSLLAGLVTVGATTTAVSSEFAFSTSSAFVGTPVGSETFSGPGPFEILSYDPDWPAYAWVSCSADRIDVCTFEGGFEGVAFSELTTTITVASDAGILVEWGFYNSDPWCCLWGGSLTIVDLTNDIVLLSEQDTFGFQNLQLSAESVYSVSTTASPGYVVIELCPADLTGDGLVDVDDLIAVILAWGDEGDDQPADVNGDDTVDVDDLVLVMLAWGQCG